MNEHLRLQADRIFDKEIYPLLIIGKTPEENPMAYVLGGQPGAGKSNLTKFLQNEKLHNNAVVINGDDFRRFHPESSTLYKQYGIDASLFTGEFASYITEKAINRASNEQYHLIIEGTFRTSETPLRTLNDLQNKGYRTSVAIMTIPAEISWASVNERYEKQLAVNEEGRMTPRSHHDLVVDKLADNANTVFQEGNLEEFLVFNRDQKLFDSNIHRGLPGNLINQELNRLNESVLTPENLQHIEAFKKYVAQNNALDFQQKEKLILQVRETFLNEQKIEKKRNSNIDIEP